MFIPAILIAAALYQVEFDVQEVIDGKQLPSRHLSRLVEESHKSVFQSVIRLPFPQGSPPYVDVGTNIELTVRDLDRKVSVEGAIELSTITGFVNLGSFCEPIIERRKVTLNIVVELATPAVILDARATPAVSGAPSTIEVVVRRVN